MKKLLALVTLFAVLFSACAARETPSDIAATTLPVYEFTSRIVSGTGLSVTRLVTQSVSCLHDYSLDVRQVKAVEAADVIILSGAGLESFMDDLLDGRTTIDASVGIDRLEATTVHEHEHEHGHDHDHEEDPHIWLSPAAAKVMVQNICDGLIHLYPAFSETFQTNLSALLAELDALEAYGKQALNELSCRDLITFHDGFGYFADAFDLRILEAVEEESGSEASAQELIHLIEIVREHELPAIFTECNGSDSAAQVISRETGATVFTLDMAMAGDSYFDAMYHNIDTVKEALR